MNLNTLTKGALVVVSLVAVPLVVQPLTATVNDGRSAPVEANRVSERPWWWKKQPKPAPITSVTISGDVLFDVDSSALTVSAATQLDGLLAIARSSHSTRLLIEGYTDSDGSVLHNQALSEARSAAVAQWLIRRGLDPARVTSIGHGSSDPAAPNDTREHKALNRRVSVTVGSPGKS